MSNRPFIAARVERLINRRIEGLLRRLGWHDAIISHTGYGSGQRLRVMGRIVLCPPGRPDVPSRRDEAWLERRGWRNLAALPAVNRPVVIRIGPRAVHVVSDRDGYIDVTVDHHGLGPGWRQVTVETDDCPATAARVLILSDQVRFGLISDIDDTIITTHLPRLLVAAWNYLVLTESARLPVPGMAQMYREILRQRPGAPVFYVSTGSWNTLPFLERFMLRHGYPAGPMLLSDWGPTNTGWFRSGREHKARALRSLARDFPQVRWLLIGDDGQFDPVIYADFARQFPDQVAAVAIRELNPVEQVLAHGSWRERWRDRVGTPEPVPEVRGSDGASLQPGLQACLPPPPERP
ncbi:MAG: DUF2183 domain-containing protein [Propionibacteriaceae bacterium]|jgi:phosphatidate phosphatase APP1|nr:DUF2183 domain-containing protein [Propionibacteriaceae bacterium]